MRVISIDCTAIKSEAHDYMFADIAEVAALRAAKNSLGGVTMNSPPKNRPFFSLLPAVVSSLLASVQFELLLPSFLARAHRPKGIDCPVTSEPGR